MKAKIVFGTIGVGIVMLLLSGIWTTLFPATSTWTDEKAQRQAEIHRRLHNLAFVVGSSQPPSMHSGKDTGQAKKEYDGLKKEADDLANEFSTAHDRPQTTAKVLKWTGISLTIIGIVAWYAASQSG
jgi:hypothetical protein